jgi:hypothetical protein
MGNSQHVATHLEHCRIGSRDGWRCPDFIWGPPQPEFQELVGLALSPGTTLADGTKVVDMIEKTAKLKRRYTMMSRIDSSSSSWGSLCRLSQFGCSERGKTRCSASCSLIGKARRPSCST